MLDHRLQITIMLLQTLTVNVYADINIHCSLVTRIEIIYCFTKKVEQEYKKSAICKMSFYYFICNRISAKSVTFYHIHRAISVIIILPFSHSTWGRCNTNIFIALTDVK